MIADAGEDVEAVLDDFAGVVAEALGEDGAGGGPGEIGVGDDFDIFGDADAGGEQAARGVFDEVVIGDEEGIGAVFRVAEKEVGDVLRGGRGVEVYLEHPLGLGGQAVGFGFGEEGGIELLGEIEGAPGVEEGDALALSAGEIFHGFGGEFAAEGDGGDVGKFRLVPDGDAGHGGCAFENLFDSFGSRRVDEDEASDAPCGDIFEEADVVDVIAGVMDFAVDAEFEIAAVFEGGGFVEERGIEA